jgi:isoleucyl-tRNA synthetase
MHSRLILSYRHHILLKQSIISRNMVSSLIQLKLMTGFELEMMLQVSSVKIVEEIPTVDGWSFKDQVRVMDTECDVMILEAARSKCPRCWTYTAANEGDVCGRCASVLHEKQA